MAESEAVRLVLVGFGKVNTTLLSILVRRRHKLLEEHQLTFVCVGASDSQGATFSPSGLDMQQLLNHKTATKSVVSFDGGSRCADVDAMLTELGDSGYDVLVDGSPSDLTTGGVGLAAVRRALSSGRSAVLANKAPLVLAFPELAALAAVESTQRRTQVCPPRLLYSSTVCGGLPVVNIAKRDLGVTTASFMLIEGVLNSTTNYILSEMKQGRGFAESLAAAQRLGIAEADPALDIDGWDTASKLVIIVNTVLGYPATLADVRVTGIRNLTHEMVEEATRNDLVYKLVATASASEGGFRLSVQPVALPAGSFLAGVTGWEMGVIFHTDLFEVVSLKIDEPSVVPTSAGMLRDILHCVGR